MHSIPNDVASVDAELARLEAGRPEAGVSGYLNNAGANLYGSPTFDGQAACNEDYNCNKLQNAVRSAGAATADAVAKKVGQIAADAVAKVSAAQR